MITYTIAMPVPHSHLFHVHITIQRTETGDVQLSLPAWTPGSYMIREFARHVQEFQATDGAGVRLPWHKVRKDSWIVQAGAATHVIVSYKVYAFDLTVRTSHLDGTHGYFNGANVFMYVHDHTREPLILHVDPQPGWQVTTGLTPLPPDPAYPQRASFQAADYDELVDCPVECGTHRLLTFTVDDVPHRIAIWGHGNEDEARLLADTKRIVEVQRALFGSLPYHDYTFILHLTDGRGGGLEHRNSATNMVDRWTFTNQYERYLSLTSHELFHAWNVKRLRPAVLGPFDYQQENYTRLLWLMEGATSYYDELLLVRAGLMSEERYLQKLADKIVQLQQQPGRRLQSLEQSSFDAWIKFYRPDENSINSSISYYLKGALVCWMFDMAIRAQTDGERSFDDVMRYLYQRYPVEGPGIPEEGAVLAAIEAVGGPQKEFRELYEQYVAGVDELDYHAALAVVGLEPRWHYRRPRPDGQPPVWLGINWRQQGERTIVASVRSDGPAYEAGVYAGDELVALDGWRVNEERLNQRLLERRPGDSVRLTLFRGDALIDVVVPLAVAPYDALSLVPVAIPTAAQLRMRAAWLERMV
ncbi:peptidase M61 domain protein [Chloroflexus aggregans DSM 9485]|uniref:Peptidase M61 domain protein n=1 Tax=Chloroflexus aggregans (strain MD-66 / DSM 9485) TaxID=326427 RepID=B8G2V1_CHLAD|nr:peptidase M61 domain protein [Chloroflexus aggregans DSM 9485]